jgi:hypothetical protein
MAEYKDVKTGAIVTVTDEKNFLFPATGAKMLLKSRPPIAKEVSTD